MIMLFKVVSIAIIALFGASRASLVAKGQRCPDSSYIYYKGTCYRFLVQPVTWKEAEKICRSYGGHLISIRDIEVSNWLKAPGQADTIPFWFGLHKSENGNLTWTDKPNKFNYGGFTDWANGEPSSAGSCVGMFPSISDSSSAIKMSWMVKDCNEQFLFICGVPAGSN